MIKLEGKDIDVLSHVHPSVKDAVQKCFEHPSLKDADHFTGKIPSAAVAASGLSAPLLADALVSVAALFAYTPVSDFHVGVVVSTTGGDLFFGANGEYRGGAACFSLHGEQCAIANGLCSALETYQPVQVVFATLSVNALPCGHCRQLLTEQQQVQGAPIEVRLVDAATLAATVNPLDALLPDPFGPADLGIKAFTLEGTLVPPPEAADNSVASAACEALNAAARVSRAPYSGAFAGLAVELGICGGPIFVGPYIENAAYNPTTSPLIIALMRARFAGHSFSEVSKCVLMELPGKFSVADVTKLQLSILAPDAKFYKFTPLRP